jgi:hypothetical protein
MMRTVISLLTLALACLAAGKTTIPPGSRIYVDSNNGFDLFIVAAFQAKHLSRCFRLVVGVEIARVGRAVP